jgi:hypothetical protein
MKENQGQPPDDVSSAPESGTVRDDTSGNIRSPGQGHEDSSSLPKDDPSTAP